MQETISDLELYDTLKSPLGESAAKSLVTFVVENGFHRKAEMFATKGDIALLKDDISNLRLATQQDIAQLEVKMALMESRIIKWMFIFLIGQAAAIISIVKLL